MQKRHSKHTTCPRNAITKDQVKFKRWYRNPKYGVGVLLFYAVFHHVSDIDECRSASPPTCESPKICINTRGGYQCVCDGTRYGDECQYSKLKLLNESACI